MDKLAVAIEKQQAVILVHEGRRSKVVFKDVYGCGGSKCAFKLADGKHALMLPNLQTALSRREAPLFWPNMVKGEVAMSERLTAAGLLNPHNQEATLYVDRDVAVPCYLSVAFDAMAKRGVYVFDDRLPSGLPHSVFHPDANMQDPASWECLLHPLIHEDLPAMYQLVLPTAGDSFHLALINSKCKHTAYVLRYFGYDYFEKGEAADYNKKVTQSRQLTDDLDYKVYARKVLQQAVEVFSNNSKRIVDYFVLEALNSVEFVEEEEEEIYDEDDEDPFGFGSQLEALLQRDDS